jgi:hypothetical protein
MPHSLQQRHEFLLEAPFAMVPGLSVDVMRPHFPLRRIDAERDRPFLSRKSIYTTRATTTCGLCRDIILSSEPTQDFVLG